MHDILLFSISLIIGLIIGGTGVTILLKNINSDALTLIKAQNQAALEAAKSAMLENATKTSRSDKEDFLQIAKSQIGPMVDPVQKSLDELKNYITTVDKDRASGYASLEKGIELMLKQSQTLFDATTLVSNKTDALVGALRGSQTRGRWGEIQLRNIVEMAGMTSWCDFSEQTSSATNGEGRPDLTVRIPGNKFAFVDSKVPMSAYLDAQETTDERHAAALRREHAKAVKLHVDELVRRGYHNSPNSVPFTVMFLPAEPLLLTAMAETPDLWEYAMSKGIMICSPMGLLPLLRAFAVGWREEQQDERAREIAKLGGDLYKRLSKFAVFFNGIGQTILTLNTRYNEAAGSFSARLLPQAQRVHKAAALIEEEIPEPLLVDAVPRQLALETLE